MTGAHLFNSVYPKGNLWKLPIYLFPTFSHCMTHPILNENKSWPLRMVLGSMQAILRAAWSEGSLPPGQMLKEIRRMCIDLRLTFCPGMSNHQGQQIACVPHGDEGWRFENSEKVMSRQEWESYLARYGMISLARRWYHKCYQTPKVISRCYHGEAEDNPQVSDSIDYV